MDMALIAAANSALTIAREIGRAAIGIRDFNELAQVVATLNEQILKAQDSLFAHNTQLFALQQDQFNLARRLRDAEEKLAERDRYTLVEISDRTFVLRSNDGIQTPGGGLVQTTEPDHHICQPCFAKGIKSVLQKYTFYGAVSLECPICKERFSTGETVPVSL